MRELNMGHPAKDFIRPSTGIVDVTVCAKSGLLPTEDCNEGTVTLSFLTGTQPREACTLHSMARIRSNLTLETMRTNTLTIRDESLINELSMPQLRIDLPDIPVRQTETAVPPVFGEDFGLGIDEFPDYNPLLD
jgi:penicillin-binding protein 1A